MWSLLRDFRCEFSFDSIQYPSIHTQQCFNKHLLHFDSLPFYLNIIMRGVFNNNQSMYTVQYTIVILWTDSYINVQTVEILELWVTCVLHQVIDWINRVRFIVLIEYYIRDSIIYGEFGYQYNIRVFDKIVWYNQNRYVPFSAIL